MANELWEALTRVKLTDKERRVLMAIMRKTYGYNRSCDEIILGQLAEETGLCRQRVVEAVSAFERRNIISIDWEGYVKRIGVQKDYEQWDSTIPETRTSPEIRSSSQIRTKNSSQIQTKNSPQTRTKTSPRIRTHKRHINI